MICNMIRFCSTLRFLHRLLNPHRIFPFHINITKSGHKDRVVILTKLNEKVPPTHILMAMAWKVIALEAASGSANIATPNCHDVFYTD